MNRTDLLDEITLMVDSNQDIIDGYQIELNAKLSDDIEVLSLFKNIDKYKILVTKSYKLSYSEDLYDLSNMDLYRLYRMLYKSNTMEKLLHKYPHKKNKELVSMCNIIYINHFIGKN